MCVFGGPYSPLCLKLACSGLWRDGSARQKWGPWTSCQERLVRDALKSTCSLDIWRKENGHCLHTCRVLATTLSSPLSVRRMPPSTPTMSPMSSNVLMPLQKQSPVSNAFWLSFHSVILECDMSNSIQSGVQGQRGTFMTSCKLFCISHIWLCQKLRKWWVQMWYFKHL